MKTKKFIRMGGIIFGAWLALLYAFVSIQVNVSSLPGIPLPGPAGGYLSYYAGYMLAGALIGLIACWPENKWVGALLGGVAGAVLTFYLPWRNALQSPESAVGVLFLTITGFVPLVLLCAPLSLVIRLGVENLPTQVSGSLNIKRIGLPLGATLIAVMLGFTSMYPKEVQDTFFITRDLVDKGISATTQAALPEPLQAVRNWFPNATGKYTLEYSTEIEKYNGPRPVTSRMSSDFLIVVRFQNKFTFACAFAPNVKVPSCTNFE